MSNGLTWRDDVRQLGDLVPWPRNPRDIDTVQAERLRESLGEFDQPLPIAIGPDGSVYDGHQRLKAWIEERGPDFEVAVRVSSRALTEAEREKLTVMLHKGAVGDWDWEELATWDAGELAEWGFSEDELAILDEEPKLREKAQQLKPREMFRVLVSVPVDNALDVRALCEQIEAVDGAEVIYGAN